MLYHLTDEQSAEQIMAGGLLGSTSPKHREEQPRKSIFVLTENVMELMVAVAVSQIWVDRIIEGFWVISIDEDGVSGQVVNDEGPDSTAEWQRIIRQDVILPEYLKSEFVEYSQMVIDSQSVMKKVIKGIDLTADEQMIWDKLQTQILSENSQEITRKQGELNHKGS